MQMKWIKNQSFIDETDLSYFVCTNILKITMSAAALNF